MHTRAHCRLDTKIAASLADPTQPRPAWRSSWRLCRVVALDHTLGVVLGQVQVALKSNEIPALRTVIQGAFLNRAAPGSQPLGLRQFP
ncbi:hypothetical protein BKA03_000438 [Demequina lutea]|uniref:Uncharacterized protein n=1 Tax=Demequina lutea TaxID=431489 RepID=A0A7Z0CH10_9MICO|nr:hypothetical protein [Demequina lutea]